MPTVVKRYAWNERCDALRVIASQTGGDYVCAEDYDAALKRAEAAEAALTEARQLLGVYRTQRDTAEAALAERDALLNGSTLNAHQRSYLKVCIDRDALTAERDALRKVLAERDRQLVSLQKNADRYYWLREEMTPYGHDSLAVWVRGVAADANDDLVDAAIDAAMLADDTAPAAAGEERT